jgi:hypothetical protein
VQLRRVDPGEAKHLVAVLEGGAVASDKVFKCERSAASAPPAPSADSSPISSRFFIGFIVVSP